MIGLDTVKLRLSEWEVSSAPALKFDAPSTDCRTGEIDPVLNLWKDGKGNVVQGTKAYFTGDPSLDVKLKRLGNDYSDQNTVGCWVEFSVPRRAVGNNFHSVGVVDTGKALMGVQRALDDIGIRTNILSAELVRADIKHTVPTEEPYRCYSPVFDLLKMSRMKGTDYGTTHLWKNGDQQLEVYDKAAEAMHKNKVALKSGRASQQSPIPRGSWANFEWRGITARKVQKVLGMRTVDDLLGNYVEVPNTYRQVMRKYFFGQSVAEVEAASQVALEGEMNRFKESKGRNWLQYYIRAQGMATLTTTYRLETVLAAAAAVAGATGKSDQRRLQRLAVELHQAHVDVEMLREVSPSKRTLADLYRELQSKVLSER